MVFMIEIRYGNIIFVLNLYDTDASNAMLVTLT